VKDLAGAFKGAGVLASENSLFFSFKVISDI